MTTEEKVNFVQNIKDKVEINIHLTNRRYTTLQNLLVHSLNLE